MCKRIVPLALLLPLFLLTGNATAQEKGGGSIKLFNGKNLDGWQIFLDPKKNADPKKIFTVKEGVLVVEGSVNGYVRTKKEYGNYVLTLEWRWGDKAPRGRNSGVFVHVVGPDKIWPKAVEAQLMADHAGDFWLVGNFDLKVEASRRDPKIARHYFRMRDNVEKPVGQWNKYEITCRDGEVKLVINGKLVNVGTQAEVTKGDILLQSEGAEIHFRNIELRPLKKE